MFWSKIWFFLVACVAGVAIAIALILPRPAQRERESTERTRLAVACDVINILLRDNARSRVELVGKFARAEGVAEILAAASRKESIDAESHATAKQKAVDLLKDMVDFAILTDDKGRVVSRTGIHEEEYGDSVAGYFVVEDALHGYMRDDLWLLGNDLYLVAASPVVSRAGTGAYVGTVVLGRKVDKELAEKFVKPLAASMTFFAGGKAVASSEIIGAESEIVEKFRETARTEGDLVEDCRANEPFVLAAGPKNFVTLVARLPGEAASADAFYAVYIEQPEVVGFSGALARVKKDDLSWGSFPWLGLALVFVLAVAGGMALMIFETDRPLRKLAADAVALAKEDAERLAEERHRGKFGSIARSVNIRIDKLHRDAKSAKKDLDQLLGPAPDDGIGVGGFDATGAGAVPGAGAPLPAMGPGGPAPAGFQPPPPSEFKFTDSPVSASAAPGGLDLDLPPPPPSLGDASAPPPAPPTQRQVPPPPVALPRSGNAAGNTPPPVPRPPPPVPRATPATASVPIAAIDDDILADGETGGNDFDAPTRVADPSRSLLSASASETGVPEAYFREVFEQFIALKQKCGEPTSTLTYDKFAGKLRKNRETLMNKHNCNEVRFQVYVKDGKAALKATPVKS